MSESRTTTGHDERRGAEQGGGRPAADGATGAGDDPGILRIAFPHRPESDDEALEEIGRDERFRAFDDNGLASLHGETGDGRFDRLVSRESARR